MIKTIKQLFRGNTNLSLLLVSRKESASVLVLDFFVVVEESAAIAALGCGFVIKETTATTADGAGGQSGRRCRASGGRREC